MKCKVCKKEKPISSFLGVCRDCILEKFEKCYPFIKSAHQHARAEFGLPTFPPRDKTGVQCKVCGNECRIGNGEIGYCGLVKNVNGKLVRLAGTPDRGLLEWYYDPHVTNCVASWACPAGTGCGYPKFSYTNGPEYGFYNLAIFYGACNFNCLFYQNWHFKHLTKNLHPLVSAEELANAINEKVSCVCFFGGTPEPQMPHMINTSKLMVEKSKGRILRICMECNGNANARLLKKFAELSFESGGIIKFDLKFFNEKLNIALTGVSNKKSYKNFEMLASTFSGRKEYHFLHASTLLIPHYVSLDEIQQIASFISSLDERIPYSLLGFYPHYKMTDLGFTKKDFALKALKIAKRAGLKNVRIGNVHLLV